MDTFSDKLKRHRTRSGRLPDADVLMTENDMREAVQALMDTVRSQEVRLAALEAKKK